VPLRPHGWLFDRRLGGGWVGAFGSHAVDFVRWTFGEIVEVESFLRTEIDERPDETGAWVPVDVEDGFTAFLVTERNVTVTIDSSFACAATFAPRMVINGTEGVLECVADARIALRRDDGSQRDIEVEKGADPHLEPMLRWAELVRDAVRDHRQIEPSFADGLACDRVLEQLRRGRRASP
jgi:predicted dehydrogenase